MIHSLEQPRTINLIQHLVSSEKPLHLEIGVGKGRFLCDIATSKPNDIFLGLEKSVTWLRVGEARAERLKLKNVHLFNGYLENFFNVLPSNNIFTSCYVLFPDPWPKTYQLRRRVLTPSVLCRLWHLLKPNGTILIATDHQDYFKTIVKMMHQHYEHAFLFESLTQLPFKTNFQLKYEQEKRNLHFAKLIKTSFPPGVEFDVPAPYLPKSSIAD